MKYIIDILIRNTFSATIVSDTQGRELHDCTVRCYQHVWPLPAVCSWIELFYLISRLDLETKTQLWGIPLKHKE